MDWAKAWKAGMRRQYQQRRQQDEVFGHLLRERKAERPIPHLTWHPGVRGGQPCVAGTRITAQEVARWHRDYGAEWILQEYSQLTTDDILLACWWAAANRVFGFRRWRRWYHANCEGRSDLAGVALPPSRKGAQKID